MNINKIILVPQTHTDIGYTGTYREVAAQHIRHFRDVIDRCRHDNRFRWTIEAAWALDVFLQFCSSEEKHVLAKLFRKGQLELTGFYTQPLTQLCSLEELCASIEMTHRLIKQAKLPYSVDTLMIDDIGGMSYNAPHICRHYGIRQIVNGCGAWRVMTPFSGLPHLFRLVGPDDSDVLFYQLGDDERYLRSSGGVAQYSAGVVYFLWPMLKEMNPAIGPTDDDPERRLLRLKGREGVDELLDRLTRQEYPYDTLLLQTGMDNCGPVQHLMEAVDQWNHTYRHPKVMLGTCREFFDNINSRFGNRIPRIRGELTCSWTEHAITHAAATGTYRCARRELNTWSILSATIGAKNDRDARLWWSIMKELLFYSDHTFGISMWGWQNRLSQYGSLQDEAFDMPRESWEIKASYADQAHTNIRRALDEQAISLTLDDPDCPQQLSVFNPHSFSVEGVIRFRTKQPSIQLVDANDSVIDVESREINAMWYLHKASIGDLGPFGLKVFQICMAPNTPQSLFMCRDWLLKGSDLVVRIDPKTGAVRSLDAAGKDQWVNTKAGHLNDIHYLDVLGVSETLDRGGLYEPVELRRFPITSVTQLGSRDGRWTTSLAVQRTMNQAGYEVVVESTYTLDNAGLHIRNLVKKAHTIDKEACFFAFPFRMGRRSRFDVDQQGQTTHFPHERLPGSSNHNFGVQRFVSIADEESQAVLTTVQSPLLALGHPSYYHFGLEYQPIECPTVFSYAFNNLWNTNCPLLQEGDLLFEYHITFFDGPFSPVRAYQASRIATQPPLVFIGDLQNVGFQTTSTNLVSPSCEKIVVDSVRPIEEGVWQIRLVNVTRDSVPCTLTFPPNRLERYAVISQHDDTPKWTSIVDSDIRLNFRPAEFKTLCLM